MCLLWFACELHWLYWGYRLEFLGDKVFLQLWGASMLFFMVNVFILWLLVRNHTFARLFENGKVSQIFVPQRHGMISKVTTSIPKVTKRRAKRAKTPNGKTKRGGRGKLRKKD